MPGSVFCQGQLGCHGIDCVQDIGNGAGGIHPVHYIFKEQVNIVRKYKLLKGDYLGVRTDVPDFFFHDLCLMTSYGAVEGDALTVDVGEGNRVVINEHQPSHPASGQRLNGMGADAAYPEYCHGGIFKGHKAFLSYKHFCSGKFVYHFTTPAFIRFVVKNCTPDWGKCKCNPFPVFAGIRNMCHDSIRARSSINFFPCNRKYTIILLCPCRSI